LFKRSSNFVFSVRDARKSFFFTAPSLPPNNPYRMSSEAKARTAALRLQFEEEMRWVELLEQEEKRAEELRRQEEDRKRQEEERRQEVLRVRKEEERKRKEVARVLAVEQKFAEEKRKKDEARIRAAEVSREKAMEEDEVETAEPAAGPHIKTKKRKRAASGFTILGMLTANGGTWRGKDGRVCNPCRRLNWSCVWRQDNKKVRTCYFCHRGKTSCTVDMEAGPLKKARTLEKGKVKESEPEDEEEEHAGPSAMDQILADILEEQRLHNERILAEISQIRRALFQATKQLKYLVNNTNNIADHLMSKDDEDGRRIIGEGKVEKAATGKVTGGNKTRRRNRGVGRK